MAHGKPDFWAAGPDELTYGSSDVAELAVRLGSPVNYDRAGNVLWMTGFDDGGRGYVPTGTIIGDECHLTADGADTGGVCLMLTTGPLLNNFTTITKSLHYPNLGGIGLAAAFTPTIGLHFFYLTLKVYDGANQKTYQVRYDHTLGVVDVMIGGIGWTLAGACGKLRAAFGAYAQMKLVIDTANKCYVECHLNEHEYDLTGILPSSGVDATDASMDASVTALAGLLGDAGVRLDNLVVTQNEPL